MKINNENTKEFSKERYFEIIRLAQHLNYKLPKVSELGLNKVDENSKFLLIRHDIDVSVSAALEMATWEHSLNYLSTYYVRLHCPYYNVLDPSNLNKLFKIRDMGHEIGLHYESQFFEELVNGGENYNANQIVEGIFKDVSILESILSIKVTSISQHNPSLSLVYPRLWEKYIDCYHPRFIKEIKYFGDSGRKWREGCLIHKLGNLNQIHALIHPYSWTKWHENWEDNFRAHCNEAKLSLHQSMEENIDMLKEYLAKREKLDLARDARYTIS